MSDGPGGREPTRASTDGYRLRRSATAEKGHPAVRDLIKHPDGTMVPVAQEPRGALAPRPDASLVPAGPSPDPAASAATPRTGPGRLAIAVIAASILAAVAVGAAAFSGGSTAGGSGSPGADGTAAAHGSLAASATDSAAASSVVFSVSATETTASSTTSLLDGHGSVDLTKGVGRVTASVPGLSSLVGGGPQGSVDVISDGTNVYLKVPGVSSLTGGKPWVETSLSGLASLTGSSASSLSLSTLADPSQALSMLGSLGSPVTKVGTVPLNGEPTTEYQTTIAVADIVSQLSHGSASSSAAAKAIQQLGVPSVPVTVWVGQDGLFRQLSVTVDLSHASLGGLVGGLSSGHSVPSTEGTKVNLTVGLSHYGEPVSVSVPSASDVTDLNSIASSLKGMASQLGGALSGIASHV